MDADEVTLMATMAEVASVRVAGGRVVDDIRAIGIVWRRELIRYARSRARIFTSLIQPVVFLFILGTGLSPIVRGAGNGIDFRTFMFPGVLAMTVLFTSIFSAVSIVWDREFGFLREMMVAPVRRGAVIFGKAFGGATVATIQGVIMLVLAGLVHVPYSPTMLIALVLEMALVAFALTAFGAMIASRMQQVESFQVVMQLFVMPLFFLSGAVFPITSLPAWLAVLTKVDPLTYAVDAMRRAVFAHVHAPAAVVNALSPGIAWHGWRLPTLLELAIVVVLGALMMGLAIRRFAKTE
ncbi:MAG TPA: ABC transporter permease [Actinomycetota bacterium]|nr:ABC transporter permease [Actinomycetota bacterium]